MDALEEWLAEEISRCEVDATESHRKSMNSYGAGFDRGYANALKDVMDKINGKEK